MKNIEIKFGRTRQTLLIRTKRRYDYNETLTVISWQLLTQRNVKYINEFRDAILWGKKGINK